MRNIIKKQIKNVLTIFALSVASYSSISNANSINNELISNLQTFTEQSIYVDKKKLTHLVFIDLWRSYEGKGDEAMIAALPDEFLAKSQQIWIQPEINVTKSQLVEFQQYFSKVKPLVVDKQFALMRALNVWQSPFHVLIQGNKKVFSGDAEALSDFIAKRYSVAVTKVQPIIKSKEDEIQLKNVIQKSKKVAKTHKPLAGGSAPKFSAKTLTGSKVTLAGALTRLTDKKPLNLIFLDSLCPMPQFPDCEAKIAKLNKLVKADSSRQWLAVVNSYYVNEEFVQDFVKKFSLDIPVLFDHDNTIYRAYDVYASPYQVKVNRQGLIESRSALLN